MFLILLPNVMNARSECFVTDALTVADVKAGHNRSKRQSQTSDRLRITKHFEILHHLHFRNNIRYAIQFVLHIVSFLFIMKPEGGTYV